MGGLVSKNAVGTTNNATETALFAHIANTNNCKESNMNNANAINDPGKRNIIKIEAGIDDFNAIKENEKKTSQDHHFGSCATKKNTQVGDKTEKKANQALEDHCPAMTNKDNIRTGEKNNGEKIKSIMKKTKRKAQNMVVVEDADEDVEEKRKASARLKTEPEGETLNAEDIDIKENQKKRRKITRKVELRKSKRKRRTVLK